MLPTENMRRIHSSHQLSHPKHSSAMSIQNTANATATATVKHNKHDIPYSNPYYDNSTNDNNTNSANSYPNFSPNFSNKQQQQQQQHQKQVPRQNSSHSSTSMVDTPPSPIRSGAHTTTNDSNTYTNNPNYPNNPPNNAHTHTHTHVPRVLSLNNMSQKNNLPSPPQLPNPNLWLPLSDDADPVGNYGLAFSSSNPSSDGDYPIARSISPPLSLRPQHKSLGKPPRIVTESLLRDYSQPKSLDSAEARMKDCEGSIR